MWAVVTISVFQARDLALQHARFNGANLTTAFSEEVDHTLGSIESAMQIVAARIRTEADSNMQSWDRDIPLMTEGAIGASFIAADGKLASTTLESDGPPGPVDLSDRPHFRVHLDGSFKGLYISEPVTGRVSKRVTIQVSKRVDSVDGKFLGVLVLHLAPGFLTHLYQKVDLGERGTLALVGLDNVVRARFSRASPEGLDGIGQSVAGGPRPSDFDADAEGFYIRESVVDHVTRVYTYRRVPHYPLVVTIGQDFHDVFASSNENTTIIISLSAAATVLLFCLALYFIRESRYRARRDQELAAEHAKLELVRVQKERAEAASHAKSLFLANMSHELRTPLNAIIGFSEVIKDQMMGPVGTSNYADYANDIFGSAHHLLRLINDLLDLSKIEAGKMALDDELVELVGLAEESVALLELHSARKRIAVDIDRPRDLPLLRADRLKLKQVLINLLSNAIKFTPAGGHVTVRITTKRDQGLVIAIADTGIGMAPEEIPVALEPFGQVDSAAVKDHPGTGIGLPLAKRLVELHGGTLVVESAKNVGTTIFVRFPSNRVVAHHQNAA
jgi:signal transduction histidine kinase